MALRSALLVLGSALVLSGVPSALAQEAEPGDKAIGLRSAALFRPVAEEAPAGNAGLFVGVNEFTEDNDIPPLRFAVHDAIEQAHLFVVRLNLIPPKNCYLAISGTPSNETIIRHLEELQRLGVQQIPPTGISLLKTTPKVCAIATDKSHVLIIGLSSHGFDDGTIPYVMPSDGLRGFLDRTGLRLRDVENVMQRSQAGHRLLLVDACQEKVSVAPDKAIGVKATSSMGSVFSDALQEATGQAKLASCDVGQFSYEYPDLRGCGHGVFTSQLLDALEGGAAADAQNLVRMKSVADYVHVGVTNWVNEQNRLRQGSPEGREPLKAQSPSWHGPKSAEALPLALKAGDLETLLVTLKKQQLAAGFDAPLRDQLVAKLQQFDSQNANDRELLASTREYLDGQLPARVFGAFLREALATTAPVRPNMPIPSSPVGSPTVPYRLGTQAGQTREITLPGGVKLVQVWIPKPQQPFTMGTPGATDNESPVQVTLTQGFWLGETEVTQDQWQAVMGTTPWQGQIYTSRGQV